MNDAKSVPRFRVGQKVQYRASERIYTVRKIVDDKICLLELKTAYPAEWFTPINIFTRIPNKVDLP